eukprot:4140902-Prorocentrum_lima.AAC.1
MRGTWILFPLASMVSTSILREPDWLSYGVDGRRKHTILGRSTRRTGCAYDYACVPRFYC